MNILKSILLSSTLITTAFGVDEKHPSSQEETASHEFSNMRLDSKSGAFTWRGVGYDVCHAIYKIYQRDLHLLPP